MSLDGTLVPTRCPGHALGCEEGIVRRLRTTTVAS
eukprot:SAG25_NODE_9457_length_371_cov_6.974265_1_plen_34_part_10